MTDILYEIKRKLNRVFWGRIVVREFDGLRREEPVMTFTHSRAVEIIQMRTEPRVGAALFARWKRTRAKSGGSLLGGTSMNNFRVKSVKMDFKLTRGVIRYKFNIKRRASARNSIRRIRKLPFVLKNRINFLKKQLKFEKATLLALFYPVFQEKVTKSALDKGSGNLFIWYDNDRVKSGEKYHLLLLRVFGGEDPLKWVWLPAEKKTN
jgi:hypothetical protein